MSKKFIVAVDGTAGAGKGTLARLLSQKLDLPFLDTGTLYRAVACLVIETGESPEKIAKNLTFADIKRSDLRNMAVSRMASHVAKIDAVRKALIDMQRDFAKKKGAILDGRDIGTVIFPDAEVKLFLTASPAVRARRRYIQQDGDIKSAQATQEIAQIEKQIIQRDRQDEERSHAPLKMADDAVKIDTDHLSISQMVDQAMNIIHHLVGDF